MTTEHVWRLDGKGTGQVGSGWVERPAKVWQKGRRERRGQAQGKGWWGGKD